MFDRIKTLFKGKSPAGPTVAGKFAPQAPVKTKGKFWSDNGTTKEKEKKPAAKKEPTPEERCGITPKMGKEEVRAKLALLYRRYNRATSSLDAGLRAEAEEMLDAVVTVRENVFGPI